jgi:hypothetical protein
MGSRLIVSAACWDQIISDFIGPIYYIKTIGYCYHLVIGIIYGVTKSDLINRCQLYKQTVEFKVFFLMITVN